ncbi:MAG: proline dehydrogenase family protein [Vicinamibacterales bacterium]
MRKALLAGSTSPWLREQAMRRAFVRRSVSRFMPGEQVEDALAAAATLAPTGITTILTRLGENLTDIAEAEAVTEHYLRVLDLVAAAKIDAQISIKPTQLGLDQDPEVCARNVLRLTDRAAEHRNFVWIDMEGSPYVAPTLALYRRVRSRTPLIGVAVQAYLYRSPTDVDALMPLNPTIRLVKGAYLEPATVAFKRKSDVDEQFYRLACRILAAAERGPETPFHIASHDSVLVDRLLAFADGRGLGKDRYEIAMLYGIQPARQQMLARSGTRVRVLISYGDFWFPWYMRRLAERPANVWFVAKNMFGS